MLSSSRSDRAAFWRNLIAQRQSSRLSVRQLCEQAGVSPASFFQWQKKLRTADEASSPDAAPALVPVRVVEDCVAEITLELSSAVRVHLAHDCDEVTLLRVLRVALAACREQSSC